MKTYYSRWIEIYQNVPDLEKPTTLIADLIANKFVEELHKFVDDFNKKNKVQLDIGEFDSKFTEIADLEEEG